MSEELVVEDVVCNPVYRHLEISGMPFHAAEFYMSNKYRGITIAAYPHLGLCGISLCAFDDSFAKKKGRAYAKSRLNKIVSTVDPQESPKEALNGGVTVLVPRISAKRSQDEWHAYQQVISQVIFNAQDICKSKGKSVVVLVDEDKVDEDEVKEIMAAETAARLASDS